MQRRQAEGEKIRRNREEACGKLFDVFTDVEQEDRGKSVRYL